MPRPPTAAVYRRRRLTVAAAVLAGVGGLVMLTAPDDDRPVREPQRPAATSTTSTEPEPVTTTTAVPTMRFTTAPGGSDPVGAGPLVPYRVQVEEGTGVDPAAFAAEVDRILADRRGWTAVDGVSLQRVGDAEARYTVVLASAPTTDFLCHPLDTAGEASCAMADRAVLNLRRWREGAAPSKLPLAQYREYLVTHEFGHLLEHDHEECPGPGARATTMMQQTYGIGPCTPNPWPAPDA